MESTLLISSLSFVAFGLNLKYSKNWDTKNNYRNYLKNETVWFTAVAVGKKDADEKKT